MALVGYRKAGSEDTRCLEHVDFMNGTPVYGVSVWCTYCEGVPQERCKECGEGVDGLDECQWCGLEVIREVVESIEVDERPMKGAFRIAQLPGWAMISGGDYYGQYLGGSEAGARACMRNLVRYRKLDQHA